MNLKRYKQMMNSTILTNESGRSMVEMLGVLAIIGVLSVMGIAGYTQAMKSYKANEIVNATSMLYMMGVSANGGQGVTQDLTYAAAFDKTLPDGVSTLTYKTNGSIELTITDESIRSRVANIMGTKATSTEGSNTLSIAMNTGTSASGGTGGNDTTSKKTYSCTQGDVTEDGSDNEPTKCGNGNTFTYNCAKSSGQFASLEAAVSGLCGIRYECISGMIFRYDTSTNVSSCNNCSSTEQEYFQSDAEAIAALCDD